MKIRPYGGFAPEATSQGYKTPEKTQESTAKVIRLQDDAAPVRLASNSQTEAPSDRAAKVAELKGQIERGEYKVEPQKLAETFVRDLF